MMNASPAAVYETPASQMILIPEQEKKRKEEASKQASKRQRLTMMNPGKELMVCMGEKKPPGRPSFWML